MKSYYTLNNYPKNEEPRILKLKIPPKWENVKITTEYNDKIQVIGIDSKNRKQYIYHPIWNSFSNNYKYLKIESLNFNKFIKIINQKSKYENILSKNYVIANMFIIMKDLNIRIGNDIYLKENDSIGLCTMQKTNFKNNKFVFKGKSKKEHEKKLNNNHLIFINKLINLPGQNLFKYLGKNNEFININSNDLNNFLKKYIDENMTSKDIRTYYANQIFKKKYKELLKNNDSKPIINAIKFTASELGNTPKVCKDSYINPNLII